MKRILSKLGKTAAAAFIAGVAFTLAAPAMAAQVMVVFDGSGSAAGRIGDIRKIDIAREALEEAVRTAPLDVQLGIAVYGDNDRESCSDFGVIALPGAADDALDAAATITPLGRSPIAEAAVAAAEAMGEADVEGTVVVITDNADNCAPDPCPIIAELHERMPNITVSVVGIAIPDDEVPLIACFAELTGGEYLRAEDADAFARNLASVLNTAWAEPVIPLPTAEITVAGAVIQGRPFSVGYQGPRGDGDQIRISWFGTPAADHIVGAFVHADGSPVMMTAPMERGAYELRYWNAERRAVLATARLQVDPIPASIEAPATVQQGQTFAVTWQTDAHGGETIQFTEPFAPVDRPLVSIDARRTTSTADLVAPATIGRYEIRLVLPPPTPEDEAAMRGNPEDRILARQTVEVVAATATLSAPATVAAGDRFAVEWTGPGGPDDDIYLAPAGAPQDGHVDAQRPRTSSLTFRAPYPAGRYELRYWSGALERVIGTATVEVTTPPASLSVPATAMGASTIAVDWTGPGALGDRIAIVAGEGDAAPVVASTSASAFGRAAILDVPVEPGRYEVRYLAGPQGAILARQPIEVTAPAVSITVPSRLEPGQQFEIAWTGPGGRFDELRIAASADDGRSPLAATRLASGQPATLTAPAEAGQYVVLYWSGTGARALAAQPLEVVCTTCPPPAPEPAPAPVAPVDGPKPAPAAAPAPAAP